MNSRDPDLEEEQPLDPAVLRVQQRLKRLLMGSSLIMVLGFLAVFIALYYRINQSSESANAIATSTTMPDIVRQLVMPGDLGTLVDVSLTRGQLVATFEKGPSRYDVLIINRTDGRVIERFELTAEAQ